MLRSLSLIVTWMKRRCNLYPWRRILRSQQFIRKMRILYRHSLIAILSCSDIENLIMKFGGEDCIAPLLVLTMNLSWRCSSMRRKEREDEMIKYRGSVTWINDVMSIISSICLLRWYVDTFPCSSIDNSASSSLSYSPLNSLSDLEWYFQCVGVDWKGVCRREYEDGTGHYRDAFILAEHHGFIPLSSVPRGRLNIIRGVLAERWDIVDKYMERGDMEHTYTDDPAYDLPLDKLEMFLRRYDVWNSFSRKDMSESKERVTLFFRAGIITDGFIESTGSRYDLWNHIPVPLSEVPMNVVEDLFSLSARRARGVRFEMIYYAVDEITRHYFEELRKTEGRPVTPSSHHRMYLSPSVKNIISLVRKDDNIAAGELLAAFVEDGRSYECEIGKINRRIAKQLDLIHAAKMREEDPDR